MDDPNIKNIREILDQYEGLKKEIKELEEEEKYLKEELEKVRNHIVYYTALVRDMKKKMQRKETMDIFDHI